MKKIKFLFTGTIIISVLCLSGCVKQKKTYKQIFEENYETYVESVMKPFVEKGADSVDARKLAECLTNKLFLLDSTIFVDSPNNDPESKKVQRRLMLDSLVDANRELIDECFRQFLPEWLEEETTEAQPNNQE